MTKPEYIPFKILIASYISGLTEEDPLGKHEEYDL